MSEFRHSMTFLQPTPKGIMRYALIIALTAIHLTAVARDQGQGQGIGADILLSSLITQVQDPPKSSESSTPVYKPRKGSTLRGRVDGTFRGGAAGEPVLHVLAPADHVGETVKRSPSLYWFLSQPTTLPLTFTLEDSRHYKPIIEVSLKPPKRAGVQMIRLEDYDETLEEHVQYRWHISLIVDPESRSKDIHAMGFLERRPKTEDLFLNTTCKDPRDAICLYAEAGLWYDAIAVISDLIAAHSKDRVLRLQRASLLDQVGLHDVAEFDRLQDG